MDLSRRAMLAGGVAGIAATTGCLGDSGDGETSSGGKKPDERTPSEGTPTEAAPGGSTNGDGYPPPTEETPEERTIDTASYETIEVDGIAVPLAPIEDTYYWYQRQEARFVDARDQFSYDEVHVEGAVLSPAQITLEDDPVEDWPKDDRIVCYCRCPHHLSSQRAADLIANGYESVYALDEGFGEWYDREYPVVGSEVETLLDPYVVEGRADAGAAGEFAWAYHDPTGQREAAPIDTDGSYSLSLPFSDVTDDSPVRIRTPTYEIERPLGELRTGFVTTDGSIRV